jgi:tetratricopeptide (TPR) repeat protein
MAEQFNYIDDYFNGLLSPEEKQNFEQRCETDEQFADEVALYIASREAARNELLEQKRNGWKQLGNTPVVEMKKEETRVVKMNRWYMLAAAASIAAIILLLVPFGRSPQQLARNYINDNLQQLSVNMDGSKDSLQLGIDFYNKKDYVNALLLFEDLYKKDAANTDALKYAGLTYLVKDDYSNAIKNFDELAATKDLFANPGLFYKALTLLKRNQGNDQTEAKELLKRVVNEKLEGEKQAAEWLKKL